MSVGGPKGQQYPSRERIHRTLPAPFEDGATITGSTPIDITIPIAGDSYCRFYWKATKAGTLKFEYGRPFPNQTTVYTTKAVDDVATLANTEKLVTIPVEGESVLKITFTPDATGTIDYADIAHQWGL